MNKNFKYELAPQWKVYEEIGYNWLPFLMFKEPPNFRSEVCNTDNRGFRFNSRNFKDNKTIFKINENKNTSLILGGSFSFGVGSTSDENTISGYLSSNGDNFLNLSGSAHIGFQEIVSIFSNINLIKKVDKIIFISGINDLYLSNFFGISYPDTFYFNSEYIANMNQTKIGFKKKIFKFFLDKVSPGILKGNNINKLKKENFLNFLFSKKFRTSHTIHEELTLSMEQKLERNFIIYDMLKKYFNCKVYFYLQPGLLWSKEKSEEEEKLFEYSNIFFKEKTEFINKLFTAGNYEYLKNIFTKLSIKYDISFVDLNEYFKKNLKKNDWIFLDSIHINDNGNKLISEIIKSQ